MYIQQIGSDCLSVTEQVLLVVQGQGMPPLPICALYLRMLKYIGCFLSLKIGCGDTSACPDNYYRALAYCPILFLFTVRLALLSVTSEVCRVLQFRDSILL